MNWSDLLAAFALYLVLDGLLPFANPQMMKRLMLTLANLTEGQLRMWGLVSITAGLILLFFVRS